MPRNVEKLRKDLTPELIEAIENLVEYNWRDEQLDYEDATDVEREGHIYPKLQMIDKWLEG